VYSKRCKKKREDVAALMTATTWMDAQAALDNGFIDSIVDNDPFSTLTNSGQLRTANLKEAKEKVQAWLDRHTPHKPQLPMNRPKCPWNRAGQRHRLCWWNPSNHRMKRLLPLSRR
ncbi:MAG: ATP-dependent Clp protease proteolytic subunit, partial [Clostridia bacterium]